MHCPFLVARHACSLRSGRTSGAHENRETMMLPWRLISCLIMRPFTSMRMRDSSEAAPVASSLSPPSWSWLVNTGQGRRDKGENVRKMVAICPDGLICGKILPTCYLGSTCIVSAFCDQTRRYPQDFGVLDGLATRQTAKVAKTVSQRATNRDALFLPNLPKLRCLNSGSFVFGAASMTGFWKD